MGERKVLNKYYPSDFNLAKIPRRRQPNNQQMKVRMMLPMSIRCQTCGNYIYNGTKFNSRKEDVVGETYLGIQIFRFYFKCTKCSAEITYRTDPQNSDYTVESGASRNFEPWRKEDESVDRVKRRRVEEEMNDVMQSLEKRSHDCKREMDILSNIYEIKSIKSIHEKMNLDSMIEALNRAQGSKVNELEEEDAALVKSIVFHRSQDYVHRINDEEMDEADNLSNNARKRRKGYQEIIPPTDYLSKTSFLDHSKRNGGAEPGIKLKSKIAVAKKKGLSMRGQPESSVLQILSSNYDSDL